MNTKLPNSIKQLFEKYGRCKIVQHELSYTGYGVCAIVKMIENEFVLIRNRSNSKFWTLPCGSVEKNESFEEACVRETFEETGFNIQITGLYCVFHFTQIPIFISAILSGPLAGMLTGAIGGYI